LGHPASHAERVCACACRAVEILAFERLRVNCDWGRLGIASLRNPFSQFSIGGLLRPAPHACLNDELLVSLSHRHSSAVLGAHHFFTNGVCSQVFGVVLRSVPGVKTSYLSRTFLSLLFFFEFLRNLGRDLFLKFKRLQADSWDFRGWVSASAPVVRGGRHVGVPLFAIDPGVCVVKYFVRLNWVFEVQMSFWDMLPHNSPTQLMKPPRDNAIRAHCSIGLTCRLLGTP
jgi:hypothetical protein